MIAEDLLDVSAYPVVRMHPERVGDMAAFDRLVAAWRDMAGRGARFAIISYGDHPDDEAPELTRARAIFFKTNRDLFRERCAVIVNIEPDDRLRALRDAEAEGARRGLGFNIVVVADEATAVRAAEEALSSRRSAA